VLVLHGKSLFGSHVLVWLCVCLCVCVWRWTYYWVGPFCFSAFVFVFFGGGEGKVLLQFLCFLDVRDLWFEIYFHNCF